MENQARDHGQENFTLPHDVVQLPSNGIFYRNKKKSIKVGYLTASDENILMGGTKDLTMSLLRAKIYEPDIKVEELLEGDVEAILIFLRNTGFGPEITLNLTDPQTKNAFKATVLLDELNVINGQQPNDDGTFTRMEREVVEINGSTDKAMISKFIESMPILDSKYIREFMNKNEPRLDMNKTIIAPSGESLTVNVGFGADFFRPFF
jgi:hypothetical protein